MYKYNVELCWHLLCMKRLLLIYALLFLFMTQSLSSFATHIFGGDLLYTNISGNTYKITLTLYGDCSASSSVFVTLFTATPKIYIYKGTSFSDTIRLSPEAGTGIEVSPVCPAYIDSTSCNGGTQPGVKKFVYSDTITLPGEAYTWKFIFAGDMGGLSQAGRSSAITNINNPGTSLMQIEADLDNVGTPNSSPDYSTIPTPFYCVGVGEEYNPGAVDPNGDSLAFSLTAAINGTTSPLTSNQVDYVSPYTPSQPLSTTPGNFMFNPTNGQMSFTADILQHALIVNTVYEYRGNVLVGTSQREMTFIFLDDCTAPPPVATITSISSGAELTGSNEFSICQGTPAFSFSISASEPSADDITVTADNVPTTASLVVTNNSTPTPTISFNWNTASLTPGIYNFYVTYKDNHCPLSNKQTVAYTIQIIAPLAVTEQVLYGTQCLHQALVSYNISGGILPRTVTVSEGSTVIQSYTDTSGIITDSLYPGDYTITASYDSLCPFFLNFSIIDSGKIPLPVSPDIVYCKGDAAQPLTVSGASALDEIIWYDTSGDVLSSAPSPSTNTQDTSVFHYLATYKTCTSDTGIVTVIVKPLPIVTTAIAPDTICYGDIIYLTAYGGATYSWSPASLVDSDKSGNTFTHIFLAETFTVTATDQNGCSDTASVAFNNIQPCCKLSYPNAFTPNDDGINDGFRIVTYGNMLHYALTIFNRWGQQIFYSEDPQHAWNGNYGGVACETGVYYYIVKATCLTGHSEVHKGDVTLIR